MNQSWDESMHGILRGATHVQGKAPPCFRLNEAVRRLGGCPS